MTEEAFTRTAERLIDAPAAAIFALLADPTRHPDIDGSNTVISVKTSDGVLKPGSQFTMRMKRGFSYSTDSTVVECEPDRVIAWQTRPATKPMSLLFGGRIWRYDLTPTEGGTLVRETWDIRPEKNRKMASRDAKHIEAGMQSSLERIERLVRG